MTYPTITTYRIALPRWDTAWEVVNRKGQPKRVRKVWDVLHLNARPHWRARHRATVEVQDAVRLLARDLPRRHSDPKFVRVVLVWAPGDFRRADPINLSPLVKVCADAIGPGSPARPGLGLISDDDDRHMEQTVKFERPPLPAGLWLEITVEET